MPNTPTARAELRKSLKRREHNRGRRSAMRTWIKRTLEAIEENNLPEAERYLQLSTKLIDKNVKWNQLHANTAARKKSQLARAVQGLRTAGQPA
ncbi:MAG: 30S ribosomal protein S20 [Planctomycetota bacterium]|nr:30S ribosomal protein S20 [Planctomycetota bacterium]